MTVSDPPLAALFGVLPNTSFSQNVGLVTMTKIVNRLALATGAVFLDTVWSVSEAGSPDLHHAPECPGRCSRHDVLFHRCQRYSADHQRKDDTEKHNYRIRCPRPRLWPRSQQQCPYRTAPVHSADLWWLRHRTCSYRRYRTEHYSPEGERSVTARNFMIDT